MSKTWAVRVVVSQSGTDLTKYGYSEREAQKLALAYQRKGYDVAMWDVAMWGR